LASTVTCFRLPVTPQVNPDATPDHQPGTSGSAIASAGDTGSAAPVEPDDSSVSYISRAAVLRVLAVLGLLAVVALVLMSVFGADAFGLIEKGSGDPAYLAVFGLVAADAVVPIFPGETTLNAASTLAANGELELVWVIVAGALGSMVGDSALYWIARRNSARIEPRVARARRDPRVEAALDFLDRGAPVLLTFGRYVPGLRFVVNATMGMTGYPYKRFLPWSALGAVLWSAYTCVLAYHVGSTVDNFPAASIVISGAITSALMACVYLIMRRHERAGGGRAAQSETGSGSP
jgi:membrane-associated protein